MEFKSGPIRLSVGPKPRDHEADRARLAAIQQKLGAGDISEAVALAEAALADGLEHPMVFNLAADRLESEDRYAEALVLLEKGHALAPGDLGLRQSLGLCLFRLRRFGQALPHFDAMVTAQPAFAQAHAARGATLEQLGRFDEAEAAFRRAHELQPQNLLAIAGLASSASRAGRHPQARAFAEQVLAAQPGFPEAVIALARADMADRDYDSAEARLHDLIADVRTQEDQQKFAQGLLDEIHAAKQGKFDA